jgi:ABC-type transporter Mla MlaB component
MLRITVHDEPRVITFRLEGELAGPFVPELAKCWQQTLANDREPIRRVDLTEVTLIDEAGKACLADLHCQGAEFITTDCLTDAIVDEIVRSGAKCHGRQSGQESD